MKQNKIKILHQLTEKSHHFSNPLLTCNRRPSKTYKRNKHYTKRMV